MSKISTYEVTPVPKLADKLIGTSVGGEIEDITYNFTLSELLNLFIPNIPANTLQGVLDYGNTATQDIILNGTIFTTYLEVTDTATILNSYLTEETHIAGSLYDRLDSAGTAGQVLRSTGTQVEWYSIPNVIPTLQQVLAAGNTADINIILSANIQALTATANNVVSNTSLSVNGTLKDKDASVGTAGQVLSSTGTKVQWIALPVYTATSPLSIDSITRVISIQQASASQNGYLSSADWITFDGKQGAISLTTTGSSGPATLVGSVINVPNYTLSGLGGVPQTRTLTINGVTYNLSADRTWTIAAGVSSVTATTPLFSTGGVNPDISIQKADSALDGYLSSADWLTFNSKQPAGNYITSLTGEATGVGPGATAVTLSTTAVTGKLLTGLNLAAGGTISATDSILIAFGKTQNQISALVGGVIFKGTWNASTNTPTLVSSVGVQGNYYIVNVAGNTNLNGITDWQVGDWAIFNGTVWDKVDNTDAVSSVNGFTGAVNLTTDNIPEGSTNLYYTNTRARTALSFVAGSGAYNNTTGVITIPTNNNQITNGSNYITLASLSAVSPLSYINTTGVFSIQVANTSQDGYLSSIDWNTFNNKQATITLTTTGTSGAATLVGATLNIPQYQSVLTNPITGTGTSGQVAYFNSTSSIISNAAFAFTPTSQLLVNNSVTAASAIARGTNLTPTLVAAANSDVLVGLDINPTFTNGAFTGVTNYAIRANGLSYFTGPNYGSFTINAASYPVLTWASNGTNFGYIGSGLITGGAPTDLNIRSTGLLQFAAGATLTAALTITSKDAISSPAAITLSRNAGAMFLDSSLGNAIVYNISGTGYGGVGSANTLLTGGTSNVMALQGTNGIQFITGGVAATNLSAQIFASTGNVLIQRGGTFTDAGFRLDVNGTARVQGLITTTGGLSSTGGLLSQQTGANSGRMTLLNLRNTGGGFTSALNSSMAIAFTNRDSTGLWADDFIELKVYNNGTSTSTTGYNFYTHNNQNFASSSVLAMSINGQSVGIGVETPNASAKLQIDSTTQGVLFPRMTTAQRTAISSPATGLIVYQTDGVEGLWLNTSTGWRELTVV